MNDSGARLYSAISANYVMQARISGAYVERQSHEGLYSADEILGGLGDPRESVSIKTNLLGSR